MKNGRSRLKSLLLAINKLEEIAESSEDKNKILGCDILLYAYSNEFMRRVRTGLLKGTIHTKDMNRSITYLEKINNNIARFESRYVER